MPKLTVTEAETLATMLDSAMRKMATVRGASGDYAWPHPAMHEASVDMCSGFYALAPFGIYI